MALLAGLGEFVGGLLVVLGLFSRLGAITLIIISVVALLSAHLSNGFFITKGGFEYLLMLIAASLSIVIEGGGRLSIDAVITQKLTNNKE